MNTTSSSALRANNKGYLISYNYSFSTLAANENTIVCLPHLGPAACKRHSAKFSPDNINLRVVSPPSLLIDVILTTGNFLYLDLSPWQSNLLHRSAACSLQEHHPQWLGNTLTLKVKQSVVEDAAPPVCQSLQFRGIGFEQVASLAAMGPRLCSQL